MWKLSSGHLPKLFAALNESGPLFLPVRKNGQVNFSPWEPGVEYCAEALNTVKSAKDFFFPQSEDLVSFRVNGKSLTVIPNEKPVDSFLVFGVRPCDTRALEILDMVFLTDPVDSFYQTKRKAGTLVTMACGEPEETCFCSSFGVNAASPGGDVAAWLTGEALYWQPITQKGEALTHRIAGLLEDAGPEDAGALAQYQEGIRHILSQLPLADVDPGTVGAGQLELFQSNLWPELSASCLGCGACTYLCPTCQCYDIRDFDTGREIRRFRCWDSCMYSDFTLMAHGNPRTTQVERFRQRFMHKLQYFPENNDGVYSCVGCGRCVAKCPVSMNIAKVIKALGVKENVHT